MYKYEYIHICIYPARNVDFLVAMKSRKKAIDRYHNPPNPELEAQRGQILTLRDVDRDLCFLNLGCCQGT